MASMTAAELIRDLRELADAQEMCDGVDAGEFDCVHEAADMSEFFFRQMQMHSPRMDGRHNWRLVGTGWPMTHCVGPDAMSAVRAAVAERKRNRRRDSECN